MLEYFLSAFRFTDLTWSLIILAITIGLLFGTIWLISYWPPLVRRPWLWAVGIVSALFTWSAIAFIQIPLQTLTGQVLLHFWCRGKEREEYTPLLPETEELLKQLVGTLSDGEPIIHSTRIRAGMTQPFGEDGMSQLIQRLFARSSMKYLGHDLRRTFCTLVREASGDEFLAMRLARDIIPGVNDRYINAHPVKLKESLLLYSPLRLIRHKVQAGESLVETGEGRTPRPEEAAQNILQA